MRLQQSRLKLYCEFVRGLKFPQNSIAFPLLRHSAQQITYLTAPFAEVSCLDMARMIFFLLSIPAALCGSLVTATLSAKNGVAATNLSSLTDEFPNCVNNSQYAQWGEGVLPSSCGNALLSVRGIIAGSRRLFLDFNFFSMENPPRRMPNNAWPLPQGAASSKCA